MLHILVIGPKQSEIQATKIVRKYLCDLSYYTPDNYRMPEKVDMVFNHRDRVANEAYMKVKERYANRKDVQYFETSAGLPEFEKHIHQYFKTHLLPPKGTAKIRTVIWGLFNFYGNKNYVSSSETLSVRNLLEQQFGYDLSHCQQNVTTRLKKENWWTVTLSSNVYTWNNKDKVRKYLKQEKMYVNPKINCEPKQKIVVRKAKDTKEEKEMTVLTVPTQAQTKKEVTKSDPVFEALMVMANQMQKMNERIDSIMNINSKLAKMSTEKRKAIETMIETFGE